MINKKQLRQLYLEKRSLMSQEEVNKKSQKIWERLWESILYKECTQIFIFVNMGNEINTQILIEQAWRDQKKIAVPKVLPKKRRMFFSQITAMEELELGHFGVKEPKKDSAREIMGNAETLIIVPGLVFDLNKYRIGYGGGYYDRYLSSIPQVKKILGVAFDFQIIDCLPIEPHDISLDMIITEKRWI